ncbi:MAG: glycoside hydrolase family 78 protein [Planctomycetaceae bacterium]|nr:glycoside hydrolase family 78 protein [Planctomycetaceae bacterium]
MKKKVRFASIGLVFVTVFSLASLSFTQTNAEANTGFERVVQLQRLDFIPYDLRVEYLKSPVGVDVDKPRFSWKIQSNTNGEMQTAYQITVFTPQSNDPVWATGKIFSPQMVGIEYAGAELKPGTVYFWNLTTWNKDDRESSTLQSRFSTGINEWHGKWIGVDEEEVDAQRKSLPARYLRKDFTINHSQIVRATASIAALGYYELYLNGHKIGDHLLDPVLTDYDKRVPYVTYEIDPRRYRPNENTIGVILGNGRYYAPRLTDPTETRTFGYPKLMFQMVLEFRDGTTQTIVSDETWGITTNGPIRENCDYDGEIYDARLEIPQWADPKKTQTSIDAEFWDVQAVEAPKGKLVAQMMPPMRKTEEFKPLSVTQVKPGVWVYDFGQNIVGWCRLNVRGPAGTQITLRHAETLQTEGPDKGMLYVANLRNAKCRDIYILKGKGNEIYEPRFTYHGFRYAEITGFPSRPNLNTLTGYAVNTDLPIVGKFECSNPLMNRIYKCVEWSVRGNYRSIPTDCPQRDERQGWQGERITGSLGEMYMFDNYALYAKWLKDIQDSQRDDGNLADLGPSYWPIYTSGVTWPSTFVTVPGSLYKMYGDERSVTRHYEAMRKWMDYLKQYVREDGTLDKENFGDAGPPPEQSTLFRSQDPARHTAPGILATAYYINNLNLLAEYAQMLGKEEEAKEFQNRAAAMTEAFNKRFYNTGKGQYDNGTQTSCVLPLAFGLVPPGEKDKVFATLVNTIKNADNHIDTGLIGVQWLNLVLSNFGRDDLVYTFASTKTYPSWGYMVENGATTIWEHWNGDTADPTMNSRNQVLLVGDLVIWLYRRVAGIPTMESARDGYLIFTPTPGGGLTYAKAEYDSIYGKIRVSWRLAGEKMFYDVTIPVGQKGEILLPTSNLDSVKEVRGKAIRKQRGVSEYGFGKPQDRILVEVPSGAYSLECEYR